MSSSHWCFISLLYKDNWNALRAAKARRRLHCDEEVEVGIRECLRMREPVVCRDLHFKFVPRTGRCNSKLWDCVDGNDTLQCSKCDTFEVLMI